ncbi:MAG: hypothetical protein ACLTGT_01715 [Oscillospiraceae bacterium]
MIHTIPYFDAHCDTIHRCHTAGTLFRDPELRAFYDTAGDLRRSGGHIDLERAGGFARYAQFFALYQSPRLVPEGSSMPEQGVLLHQRFLREMEENRGAHPPPAAPGRRWTRPSGRARQRRC